MVARPPPLPDPVRVGVVCERCEEWLWQGSVGGPLRARALGDVLRDLTRDHQRRTPACSGAFSRALRLRDPEGTVPPAHNPPC